MAIVNAANCAVTAGAGGAFVVTKTGGTEGSADASAVSDMGASGDFVLRVRALTGGTAYVGVSTNPLVSHNFTTIERAFQLGISPMRIYESGTLRLPSFTFVDYAWLKRTGTTLTYLTGPDLATAAVKRTVSGVGGTLYFDSSLLTIGVSAEVKFGSPAAFAAKRRRQGRLAIVLGV